MFYELDERSFSGLSELDDMHVEIAAHAKSLEELLSRKASFEEVHAAFRRFKAILLVHFDLEESYLPKIDGYEDTREHLRLHQENHDQFRNMLAYAEEKFREKHKSGEIPNVVALIPQEYFQELMDLDAEMNVLFAKYGVTERMSA